MRQLNYWLLVSQTMVYDRWGRVLCVPLNHTYPLTYHTLLVQLIQQKPEHTS